MHAKCQEGQTRLVNPHTPTRGTSQKTPIGAFIIGMTLEERRAQMDRIEMSGQHRIEKKTINTQETDHVIRFVEIQPIMDSRCQECRQLGKGSHFE